MWILQIFLQKPVVDLVGVVESAELLLVQLEPLAHWDEPLAQFEPLAHQKNSQHHSFFQSSLEETKGDRRARSCSWGVLKGMESPLSDGITGLENLGLEIS